MLKKQFKVLLLSVMLGMIFMAQPSLAKTIEVRIDNQILETDQAPIVRQGRTLVPLRAIFEGLGTEVTWYQSTGSIFCYRDGASISLTVNDRIGYINGKSVTLDVPPIAVNGRTMVPVRVVSEALGATCEWKGEQNLVDITSNDGYVGLMRVDYESLLPSNLRVLPPNFSGTIYMEGNMVNHTDYPILGYSLCCLDKKTGESHYLSTYDTVLPGEISPKIETFAPASGRLSDLQYQSVNVNFKTPYGKFYVAYDYRLHEIKSMFKVQS